MDKEIWKDIEGYEGKYQISNLGRVRSWVDSRNNILNEPKVKKLAVSYKGYCEIYLLKNRKRKKFKVHRLVAQAFISNPNNKEQVNHIDGNKQNNKVENLEWCTQSENMRHAFKNHLFKDRKGENNSRAKLTNEQAKQIRKEYVFGSREYGSTALARKYGVTYATIWDIIHNNTYKE